MIDLETWYKAWALLDAKERRNAWLVLGVIIVAALSSAAMVGSVMPFLSVLSDPSQIHNVPALSWAYEIGGFTNDFGFLLGLGIGSLAVIVLSNALQIFRTWVVTRFTLMRIFTLSHRLLAAYLRQPYEYFLDHHTGEMSTQILSESQIVVSQFLRPCAEMIAAVLTVCTIVALLIWVNPYVALISFSVLGIVYGGIFWLTRAYIKRQGQVRAASNRERFRLANEALGGVKVIKLLGRERAYLDRYQQPAKRMAQAIVSIQVFGAIPHYLIQAVGFGGIILLCLVLMDPSEFESGQTLGSILPVLGVFAFGAQRLLPELSRIYAALSEMNATGAAVDAIYADLSAKFDGILLRSKPTPLGLKKELRLKNVSYSYPSATHVGLRDISFSIRAGEKIGVIGSTGAGKTTLADIILGLLRPHEGSIVVDESDVTDKNLRAWQQTVGYVPQEIFLTDASVAENIALGLTLQEIDNDCLYRAAKIAQIDAFIRNDLPQGYQTLVGERGVRLSGGQRQRIGIARALYHNADLIVFDEATSALDNLTERDVMKAIEALPGSKTVIMIAHRMNTVKACDRILVLNKGQLVGLGSWDELASSNEHFQSITEVLEES